MRVAKLSSFPCPRRIGGLLGRTGSFSRLSALVVALGGVTPLAHADRIDDYVRQQMRRRDIPGVSIAIVRSGRVVKTQGYGFADLEQRVPATPRTVYDIGSITKSFTATVVTMLEREGKITLDDPVTKHLPQLAGGWDGITIRHLLTHTSGKKSVTVLSSRPEYTEEEFLRRAAAAPTEFPAGTRWAYNNTGYHLLGLIVERATAAPFWGTLADRVLRPLGMTATGTTDPKAIIPHRARGYVVVDGHHENAEAVHPASAPAAGGLVSTVLDLAKWDATLPTGRLLPTDALERMWTPTRLTGGKTYPYGLGWFVDQVAGHRNIRHGGQSLGFATSLSRYPEDRLTVIVLTNLGRANAHAIADGIAAFYLADLVPKPIADRDPARTTDLRTLLTQMASGRLPAERFAPGALATIFPGGSSQAERFLKPLGPIESLRLVERRDDAQTLTDRLHVGFQKGEYVMAFTRNREGKITKISVQESGWRPPPSP